jgi:hypothetical protein
MTALFVTTFELLIRWLVLNVREDRALRIARARLQGLERMFPFLLAGHLSLNVEDLKPSFPLPDSTEGFYLPSRMHLVFSTIENCIFSPEGLLASVNATLFHVLCCV